jgi:hypothetical protein
LRKTLKLSKRTFIHGLTIVIPLVVIQLLLDVFQHSFLLFMPPIGFALFLFTTYGIQPLIVGAINISVLHRLYNCEGWQIGFWLNGFFLLITFSTLNLIIQTITGVSFYILAIPEIFLSRKIQQPRLQRKLTADTNTPIHMTFEDFPRPKKVKPLLTPVRIKNFIYKSINLKRGVQNNERTILQQKTRTNKS